MKNNGDFLLHLSMLFLSIILLLLVILLLLKPMTASAAEKEVGGPNNTVSIRSTEINNNKKTKSLFSYDFTLSEGYEAIGYLHLTNSNTFYEIVVQYCKDGKLYGTNNVTFEDAVGMVTSYKESGEILDSISYTKSNFPTLYIPYLSLDTSRSITCTVKGMKIFSDYKSMFDYINTGSLDGMIKEEYESDWYLKDLDYKVDADDSPTSEAGEDATYITFKWSIDNLEDGDLLEIKTHNYLKKIGGDKISGFHDYITWANNVSAYSGKYRFSQYDATIAWFNTLENKPLFFKSYDTDIYYLRPYRNGVYGRWVKVTIGRSPAIKGSPYVEDVEYGDFDEDGEWIEDKELTDKNGGHHGIDQNGNLFYPDKDNPFEGTNVAGIFSWFFNFMKDIPSLLGELPALVSSIVSFLPSYVIGFIAIGIVVAIILRITGR